MVDDVLRREHPELVGRAAGRVDEHGAAVVAQLGDGLADVGEGAVATRVLGRREVRARVAAP